MEIVAATFAISAGPIYIIVAVIEIVIATFAIPVALIGIVVAIIEIIAAAFSIQAVIFQIRVVVISNIAVSSQNFCGAFRYHLAPLSTLPTEQAVVREVAGRS